MTSNCFEASAQYAFRNSNITDLDSIDYSSNENAYKLEYTNLIGPTILIGYGIVSLEGDGLKRLNTSTREEINEHLHKHTTLDNYTQYAPVAFVYGLNAFGAKGLHNFKERTIIYASSQLIAGAFVRPLKYIVKEKRPDRSNDLSFPSGHTTTAFSSAHFMFREYKDSNFWLSIFGYPFAIFTGVYRIINDKHWGRGCGCWYWIWGTFY